MFTAVQNVNREHGPWTRSPKNDTRAHGPCSQSTFLTLVARVEKSIARQCFFQHGPWTRAVFKRLSTLHVFTGRVHAREHGPWTRVVWTGARVHGPWTRPVFTARVHGPALDPPTPVGALGDKIPPPTPILGGYSLTSGHSVNTIPQLNRISCKSSRNVSHQVFRHEIFHIVRKHLRRKTSNVREILVVPYMYQLHRVLPESQMICRDVKVVNWSIDLKSYVDYRPRPWKTNSI